MLKKMRKTQRGHVPRVEVLVDLGDLIQDPGVGGLAPAAQDLQGGLGVEAHAVFATVQGVHVALVKAVGLLAAHYLQEEAGEAEAALHLTREPWMLPCKAILKQVS